jgi:polysaccharide biosynthesis transport protein
MASSAYSDLDQGETLSRSADERSGAFGPGSLVARRWLSILVWLVLALAAALAYLAWSPPLYTASTSILLDPRGGVALSAPESNAGRIGQDGNLIESQLRLVSSQAVLARVVETQRLLEDSEFSTPPEPLTLRLREFLGWEPAAPIAVEQRVMSGLAERLQVTRSERATIIDIAVTSRDPAKAARIADAVAAAFVESQNTRPREAGHQDDLQNARLRELEEMLRSDERKLEAFRAKHPGLAADATA